MKKRLNWVDVCKGLAIILVVVGHVVSSFHNSGAYVDTVFFNRVGEVIYSFHMPLFFIISGYLSVISLKKKDVLPSIMKKLISYGIPYLIFSGVAVVLKLVAEKMVNSTLGLTDLIGIVYYPIGSLWFLYALLVISVINILAGRITDTRIGRAAALTVSFGLMVFAYYVEKKILFSASRLSESIIIDVCKYLFWYEVGAFLIGFIVRFIEDAVALNNKVPLTVFTLSSIILFVFAVVALRNNGISNFLTYTVLAAVGSTLMIMLSVLINRARLLELLGKSTMEIYLLHTYVVSAARILLVKLNLTDANGIIPLIVCGALGVVVPVLIYQLVKRVKFIDFCFYPQRYIKR